MKKISKAVICTVMIFSIIFSFVGCSAKLEITEATAKETIETAVEALKNFDIDELDKYVKSDTLSIIIGLAKDHEQFAELGKAMFEGLSIEVKSVDIENKTIEAEVVNRNLYAIASNFAYDITSNYTTMQMLSLLESEFFLDNSLQELTDKIKAEPISTQAKTITLKIVENKRNLAIEVDETAEDAISGGALYAVKGLISSK